MAFRFGSDRVRNADRYLSDNAADLMDLETAELHPDVVAMYRKQARAKNHANHNPGQIGQ